MTNLAYGVSYLQALEHHLHSDESHPLFEYASVSNDPNTKERLPERGAKREGPWEINPHRPCEPNISHFHRRRDVKTPLPQSALHQDALNQQITAILHKAEGHPCYEYDFTEGHEDHYECHPPEQGDRDIPWMRNLYKGENGYVRFDPDQAGCHWLRVKFTMSEPSTVNDLEMILHRRQEHPLYEYYIVEGPLTDVSTKDGNLIINYSTPPPECANMEVAWRINIHQADGGYCINARGYKSYIFRPRAEIPKDWEEFLARFNYPGY